MRRSENMFLKQKGCGNEIFSQFASMNKNNKFSEEKKGNRETNLILSCGFIITGFLTSISLFYDLRRIRSEIKWLTKDNYSNNLLQEELILEIEQKIGETNKVLKSNEHLDVVHAE